MKSRYDCIHCEACSDVGDAGFSCLKVDASKCKHFKNKADFVKAKWIDVNEWLPVADEKDESGFFLKAYLVAQHNGFLMKTARWNGKYWILWGRCTVLQNVTHWMPLPKPPEAQ